MDRRVDRDSLYGFDEIVADVNEGADAAVDRMMAGGLAKSKISTRGLQKFKELLCHVIDVTAWSVTSDTKLTRWNRRSIKLFAEVLAVGYLARHAFKEPAMSAVDLREYLLFLGKVGNSVTHN